MLFTKRSFLGVYLCLPLLVSGCQSTFELEPGSLVPRRWANDARVRGCHRLDVSFSSWEPSDKVTARIRCKDGGSAFSEEGRFHWAEPDEVVSRTPAKQLTIVHQFGSSEQFYKAVTLYPHDDQNGEVFLRLVKEIDHQR